MLAQIDDVMVPVTPGPLDQPAVKPMKHWSNCPSGDGLECTCRKYGVPPSAKQAAEMQASRPATCGNAPRGARPPLRTRLVGLFLDGVIWFSIFAAANGFALLAAAIYHDIRELAGF